MPHIGHRPGAGRITSGCIGHVYTAPASGLGVDSVGVATAGSTDDNIETGDDSGALGFDGSIAAGMRGGSETHDGSSAIVAVPRSRRRNQMSRAGMLGAIFCTGILKSVTDKSTLSSTTGAKPLSRCRRACFIPETRVSMHECRADHASSTEYALFGFQHGRFTRGAARNAWKTAGFN